MRRTLSRIAVTLLIVCIAVRVTVDVRERRHLRRLEQTLATGLAEERSQTAALRSPVLRGARCDRNAAPLYIAAIDLAGSTEREAWPGLTGGLSAAARGGPCMSLEKEVDSWMQSRQRQLTAIRDASCCSRCTWSLEWADIDGADLSRIAKGGTLLGYGMIIEGHRLALSGDVVGAAQRYLDAVAYGCNFRGGTLAMSIAGTVIADASFEALGKLLRVYGPPPEGVVREIRQLEPYLPSVDHGVRLESLATLHRQLEHARTQPTSSLNGLLFSRYGMALAALSEEETLLQEIGRAAGIDDLVERATAEKAIEIRVARAGRAGELLRVHPTWAFARSAVDYLRTRYGVLVTALETASLDMSKGTGSVIATPRYDFYDRRHAIHSSWDNGGAGRAWSVGPNSVDDHGGGDDIVVGWTLPRAGRSGGCSSD